MNVIIVGGGVGGLTLALCLHKRGVPCRVYESAPRFKPLGVGISLLPHGTRELIELGLLEDLRRVAVEFKESSFFNSFGQLIYRDPARPDSPQFLIHRADLHGVLYDAALARLGPENILLDHTCVGVQQDAGEARVVFRNTQGGQLLRTQNATVVIGCDGIHSVIRRQFYPHEGPPVFSGINLWRGVARYKPFLTAGSHVRAGALDTGKLVLYPIRNNVDDEGRQLINFVAEIRDLKQAPLDWNAPGRVEDFIHIYQDWHFDWLDVADLLIKAEIILRYPMSDRDPLPRWTFGRVTLLGDAAHPMVPRGSNGAMQAMIDSRLLADVLVSSTNPVAALKAYEDSRLALVNRIVLTNRSQPPDLLIETVEKRTGHKPFERLEDVIAPEELRAMLEKYKRLAGYSAESLACPH